MTRRPVTWLAQHTSLLGSHTRLLGLGNSDSDTDTSAPIPAQSGRRPITAQNLANAPITSQRGRAAQQTRRERHAARARA